MQGTWAPGIAKGRSDGLHFCNMHTPNLSYRPGRNTILVNQTCVLDQLSSKVQSPLAQKCPNGGMKNKGAPPVRFELTPPVYETQGRSIGRGTKVGTVQAYLNRCTDVEEHETRA